MLPPPTELGIVGVGSHPVRMTCAKSAIGPNGRPGEVLELIRRAFEELGCATTFATLNSATTGLPSVEPASS
jgi:hypothetical protein